MKNFLANLDNKVNYKYTTWAFLTIIALCLVFKCIWGGHDGRGKGKWKDDIKMGDRESMQGMHMMSDGSMMSNDGKTMSHDMQGMMMDMTKNMEGKTGEELDKTFLQDMIVHHQGAVDMAKMLKAGTKRPELQKFADDIINLQSKEIEMQKTWLSEWFK